MKYYIDLPEKFREFLIIPSNLNEMIPIVQNRHELKQFPMSTFITLEGLQWFSDRNIVLKEKANLFRLGANSSGPIHSDTVVQFAFNFVLSGFGEMQWVTADGETEQYSLDTKSGNVVQFEKYKMHTVTNVKILERWTGEMALVNTLAYHCIKTTSSDRICLSIRTLSPLTFEEVVNAIDIR